jgi:hypothetical protein
MYSLKNNSENIFKNISYDFFKLMSPKKSRCDIPSDTTPKK